MSTELTKIEYLRSKITSLADHIRAKAGKSDAMTFAELEAAVDGITTGSSGGGDSTGGGSSTGGTTADAIEGGFKARFFDENNELIQVTVVESGLWIDKPMYECGSWQNENGFPNTFPLILSSNVDFYARSEATYADRLYAFYGFNKSEYPYISIFVREDGNGHLAFLKDWELVSTNTNYKATEMYWASVNSGLAYTSDVLLLTESIMQAIAVEALMYYENDTCIASPWNYNYYGGYTAINFDDGVYYGGSKTVDLLTVIESE